MLLSSFFSKLLFKKNINGAVSICSGNYDILLSGCNRVTAQTDGQDMMLKLEVLLFKKKTKVVFFEKGKDAECLVQTSLCEINHYVTRLLQQILGLTKLRLVYRESYFCPTASLKRNATTINFYSYVVTFTFRRN